jgi:hypothetical protein
MVFKIRNPELLRGQTNDTIAGAVKRVTNITYFFVFVRVVYEKIISVTS